MELKFKKLQLENIELLRSWRNSELVNKSLLSRRQITPEMQRNWFEANKDGENNRIWIASINDEEFGYVQLSCIDFGNRSADPGMYICSPEFQGKGLAKHMMLNLMHHSFEVMNLNKIFGPIIADNVAALSGYLKAGFKIEGYQRRHVHHEGDFKDLVLVAYSIEEWRNNTIEFVKSESEKW